MLPGGGKKMDSNLKTMNCLKNPKANSLIAFLRKIYWRGESNKNTSGKELGF